MIEIFLIIGLYRVLKNNLANKGLGTGLAWLGPLFWICGEIAGIFFGAVISGVQGKEPGLEIYIYGIVGALAGAVLSYIIVAVQRTGRTQSISCPCCNSGFWATPDALNEADCPACGARLHVSKDGLVYEASPPRNRRSPASGAAHQPDANYPQTPPPPAKRTYAPPVQEQIAAKPASSYTYNYDEEEKKPSFLLITAIAICAIVVAAIVFLTLFGNSLGIFGGGESERYAEESPKPASPVPSIPTEFPETDYPLEETPYTETTQEQPAESTAETNEEESEPAAKIDPEDLRCKHREWLAAARQYMDGNKYKEARRCAKEVLKIDPEDQEAKSIIKQTGSVVFVPDDHPTIQAAIDAAESGQMILVASGIYKGEGNMEINFNGKAVSLISSDGPEYCIVDCKNAGRAFIFKKLESNRSVVKGFTIKNGNVPENEGGAVYCSGSVKPTFIDCKIVYNSAGNGGAISCWNGASPTFINCVIAKNSVLGKGGALSCWNESNPELINCTVVGNSSNKCGGGIAADERSKPSLKNCIIWDNKVMKANEETTQRKPNRTEPRFKKSDIKGHNLFSYDRSSLITLENCCIRRNTYDYNSNGGPGKSVSRYCISNDPEFTKPKSGDYSLADGSPCIDRGDNKHLPKGIDKDIAGNSRKVCGRNRYKENVDMGAFERQ